MTKRTLEINVPALARVEGEGALELRIDDGQLTDVRLRIYEPPRYFEKFLEGRSHQDVIDSVARICGICPVAYQMSAVQAIESIFGVTPSDWVREMRRVMYCGEWLQSHSLHVHMLAAPDFLGCSSVIEMAREHDAEVRRGLRLQELGNDLIALFGGRSVHPVGVCAGGFFKAPPPSEVAALVVRLEEAWDETDDLIRWTASLPFPEDQQDFVSVGMRSGDEYALNRGHIVSDQGLNLTAGEYESRFTEHQEPHSTALHSLLDGHPYLVGPLARVNLNLDQLPPGVAAPLQGQSVCFPSRNMFHSIVARALEIRLAIFEALRLLRDYSVPDQPRQAVTARAGVGYGCTEAPRGLLWHRYELDADGRVISARIVPPTSQNQARIEEDLRSSIETFGLDQPEPDLRLHAETVIRNYDPCISCSTHFLTAKIIRECSAPEEILLEAGLPIKIIAVGSPFGGDSIAWKVTKALEARHDLFGDSCAPEEWRYLDRPGVGMVTELLEPANYLILDAALGMPPEVKVAVLSPELNSQEWAGVCSSHASVILHAIASSRAALEGTGSFHLIAISVDESSGISKKFEREMMNRVERILRSIRFGK